MFPLVPNQQFPFVWQLGDPADTNTNYVQIVVSYSASSKVITTLNLTDKGNQKFVGSFLVPSDITGNGYYLDIKISIYSDSGYTTLSPNYPIASIQYFVNTPISAMAFNGGGDGIDEGTLIKILEKMLGKHIGGLKFPKYEQKEIDFSPLYNKHDMVIEMLMNHSKYHKNTHAMIDSVHQTIKGRPVFEKSEPTDLYPAIEGIQNLSKSLADLEERLSKRHADFEKALDKRHSDLAESMKKDTSEHISAEVKKTISEMKGEIFQIHVAPTPKPEKKTEMDPRIKKLISTERVGVRE